MPKAPTPPPPRQTLLESVGIPEHVQTLRSDPESAMNLSISKHMYSASAPGYIVRDGPRLASTMKKDYVWDEEEVRVPR